jgi:hypothetical protein
MEVVMKDMKRRRAERKRQDATFNRKLTNGGRLRGDEGDAMGASSGAQPQHMTLQAHFVAR